MEIYEGGVNIHGKYIFFKLIYIYIYYKILKIKKNEKKKKNIIFN